MTGLYNEALCAKCGGQCCKRMPGRCNPEDFGLPGPAGEQKLLEALQSGRYAVDWWEGDINGLEYDHPDYQGSWRWIRPVTVGKEGQLRDASWGGMCTFYTCTTGCSLAADDRPCECRMLEPKDADTGERCVGHWSDKRVCARAWGPYRDLITRVMSIVDEQKER